MKIIVCLKQVPAKDAPLRLAAGSDGRATAIREDVSFEMNEPDAYALEAALQLKEACLARQESGEVAVLTVGPARAAQMLREALAKGADRALHIETPSGAELDSHAIAVAMAAGLQSENFDLILTGLQSDDAGYAQTGLLLAENLGLPHATIIMKIEPHAGGLRVKRELEGGRFQWLELPRPALLTIQSGIDKLRYATLLGIKQAKNKPLARLELSALGVSPDSNRLAVARLAMPEKTKATEMLAGTPAEMAAALAQKLRQLHLVP